MKYLRLYENYFDNNPESDLFNYVWQCIENSYPKKIDLIDLITLVKKRDKANIVPKDSWIRIVVGCLTDQDKEELGNFFINNYLRGKKNKYFFAFLYERMKIFNPQVGEILKQSLEL